MKKTTPPLSKPKREVFLQVRSLMASKNIKTASELHRRLINAGVDISNSQLVRILENTSTRLNMDVVNGLLNLFECSVSELIGEREVVNPAAPSVKKTPRTENVD